MASRRRNDLSVETKPEDGSAPIGNRLYSHSPSSAGRSAQSSPTSMGTHERLVNFDRSSVHVDYRQRKLNRDKAAIFREHCTFCLGRPRGRRARAPRIARTPRLTVSSDCRRLARLVDASRHLAGHGLPARSAAVHGHVFL